VQSTPEPGGTKSAQPIGRVHGRGLVAGMLASMAVVLVLSLGVVVLVVSAMLREKSELSASQRADVTVRTLAPAAMSMVSEGDLSNLRRLLPELVRDNGLEEISVSLPDGQIVAHSEPARISLVKLPEKWSAAAVDESLLGGGESVSRTVPIPGRGALILTVRAQRTPISFDTGVLTVFSALAGVSALGMYFVFRRVAGPLQTLGMIGNALKDVERCGDDLSLLEIDERRGPEARAWNRLLVRIATAPTTDNPSTSAATATREDGTPTEVLDGDDLEQAVNILPTGVLIVDRGGIVRQINNMGAMLTGGTRDKAVGRPLAELLPGKEMDDWCASLASGTMPRRTMELKRQTGVGESVLRVHCRPLRREDEGAALIIVDDVTQQRMADASRNLFIAQATHELRTPLTNMRLAIEELTGDDAEQLPSSATLHVNMVQTEVRRLERIVSDMLAVAEIEAGSLKLTRGEVKLDRLLAEIQQDHGQQATAKGIELKVELPPKLPALIGDREKLAQALHNLLGNAVKYTPSGGKVRLVVSDGPEGGVKFAVIDTGMGISPEDQGRLFNRFVRGTDPRLAGITGTGLGLALSREIARLHGGEITVESELDKGSTFTLVIPGHRTASRTAA
jgi:PAS domain S-box-containing protein